MDKEIRILIRFELLDLTVRIKIRSS